MFDTSRFLDQVKIKATPPPGRYTDPEILAIAYDVLLSQMVPLILNLKEEYYVASQSQSLIAGVAEYAVPAKAFGLMLREVKLVRQSEIVNLYRIDPADQNRSESGTPEAFWLEAQNVVLWPTPSASLDSLRLSFYLTPNKPVELSEAARITQIDTVTGIITATPPTSWTANDTFSFISRENGHRSLASGLSATLTSSTLQFNPSSIPSTLAVGDYISLDNEAPYFQMPDNAFPLLVQMTANEILENLGDQAPLQIGLAKAERLKADFTNVMSTRVQGEPRRSRIHL